MSYRATVEWASAYELSISLQTFMMAKLHKVIDLGPAWAARVKRLVPADFMSRLHQLDKDRDARGKYLLPVEILIHLHPEVGSADAFITWLESRSPGELYEELASGVPEDMPLPRDLGAARDVTVGLLRTWNDAYFRQLDPIVVSGLARDAAIRQASPEAIAAAAGRDSEPFVEEVTGGVLFDEIEAQGRSVVLVPQYHFRPLNAVNHFRNVLIVGYGVDVQPPAEGEPPTGLLRLAKSVSDASRLRILRYLAENAADTPRTLTEVAEATGLAASTIFHHILMLRSAGLIRTHHGCSRPDRYSWRRAGLDELRAGLEAFIAPQS